jgi:hypothetical protein
MTQDNATPATQTVDLSASLSRGMAYIGRLSNHTFSAPEPPRRASPPGGRDRAQGRSLGLRICSLPFFFRFGVCRRVDEPCGGDDCGALARCWVVAVGTIGMEAG